MGDDITAAFLSEEEARARFWLIDRQGLLTSEAPMLPFQEGYARKQHEVTHWKLRDSQYISLYDVVYNVKPTILIGCST